MAWTLLLADSEIADCRLDGTALTLRFSAAQVHEDGAPGTRPRHGHAAGVRLRLEGVRVRERDEALFGRLAAGRVEHGGRWTATLPLPARWAAPLRLELAFANRGVLVAEADALTLEADAPLRIVESLAC